MQTAESRVVHLLPHATFSLAEFLLLNGTGPAHAALRPMQNPRPAGLTGVPPRCGGFRACMSHKRTAARATTGALSCSPQSHSRDEYARSAATPYISSHVHVTRLMPSVLWVGVRPCGDNSQNLSNIPDMPPPLRRAPVACAWRSCLSPVAHHPRRLYELVREEARKAGAAGVRLYADDHNAKAHEAYKASAWVCMLANVSTCA
jgi:hypothetical protein